MSFYYLDLFNNVEIIFILLTHENIYAIIEKMI